ncbi:PREDICTED: uncharacterized protein LOC104612096 [Nelumbo nucifera]|uniref:Uncharacterized protein LOC104612096 n=2 Tax=Nelumbo nucifera TaxID=4432 RepID=A0A1U8BL88_NELNU|nr:PREDICTED: uncharacterized protein LOC104612096 [Nelumbo nucifera]DAD24790.1 TPA_asm: hypothetical protein HUJ06_026254 [Nelumbo nucifera]
MGKTQILVFVLLLQAVVNVNGRFLRYRSSSQLVSDGMDDESPMLLLKSQEPSSSEACEHMYGFLPCTENLAGHLFLVVVYEYMLFIGEKYLSSGSKLLFEILGEGVYGASFFHILGTLPESMILLVSGLSNSKEIAQKNVLTGVGLLVGSTVLHLTIVWGTCVIVGKHKLSEPECSATEDLQSSASKDLQCKRQLRCLTGSGITTDLKTSYTARIMVLSGIPFIVVQLPRIFRVFSWERVIILFSLIMCFAFLLFYFIYQLFRPWIQERSLNYVKHEHMRLQILKHVENQALEKLLADDGTPNTSAIKRLFEKIDLDADSYISYPELREMIKEIKFGRINVDKDDAIAEVINEFDTDDDHKITMDEFVNGLVKWLSEAKDIIGNQAPHQLKSSEDLYKVFKPLIRKRKLTAMILAHLNSIAAERLLKSDGAPNLPIIKGLFKKFDQDGDNCITQSELKELIFGVKFGKIQVDKDGLVKELFEELDTNHDHNISEEEFIGGIERWLSEHKLHKQGFASKDRLDLGTVDHPWIRIKAVLLLLLGITILSLLAEPLIESVQNFSSSANIPSFFVSFVMVPLATNSREAASRIISASRKKSTTTSWTFSEIYGGVFMNNILGLSVLLCLIFFRGLTWDFSTEALVVLVVCTVMGLFASFRSTFPLWTCFMAYLMYPFSLVLVYVFNYALGWS